MQLFIIIGILFLSYKRGEIAVGKIIIETPRLILRTWTIADIAPYYDINQDPKVIQFLRGPLSEEEIQEFIHLKNQQQAERGYTLWAAQLKKNAEFMGFIGLNYIDWPASFTPAVEIAWRLGAVYWNQGYATEGAKAALAYGFNTVGLAEIVSFTNPSNRSSIRVMEKIGLIRDEKGDFAHPRSPTDHPLSPHILYRLTREAYLTPQKK